MNEEFKPRKWLLVVLIIIAIAISVALINKIIVNKKEKTNGIFDMFFNTFDKIEQSFDEADFEFYSGTKMGSMVSSLIDEVVTNNKKNKDHMITVVYGDTSTSDPDKIIDLKVNFERITYYEVILDYDNNKKVNKVTIKNIEKKEEKKVPNKTSFNSVLEMYSGKEMGHSVTSLLDKVITSNKTNPDYLITVIYGSTNSNDTDAIKSIEKSLDVWTYYDVTLDYDENGYVNKITIKEW